MSRARLDTVQDLNDIRTTIEHNHLPYEMEPSTRTGGGNPDAVPSMVDDERSIQKMYSDLSSCLNSSTMADNLDMPINITTVALLFAAKATSVDN